MPIGFLLPCSPCSHTRAWAYPFSNTFSIICAWQGRGVGQRLRELGPCRRRLTSSGVALAWSGSFSYTARSLICSARGSAQWCSPPLGPQSMRTNPISVGMSASVAGRTCTVSAGEAMLGERGSERGWTGRERKGRSGAGKREEGEKRLTTPTRAPPHALDGQAYIAAVSLSGSFCPTRRGRWRRGRG